MGKDLTACGMEAPGAQRTWRRECAAVLTLALAVLAILWPLGLTNRVLAGVDALTYFTPYWAYRMSELRAGHVPLWNPFLFLGVPFLANPQSAVLYPLHWPLIWLSPARALIWSAILHAWLAAGFSYTFARRSLRLSRAAAWLAGLLFGAGGFALARLENINQLNALAWLPALLWLLDEAARARVGWRARVRWACALAAALAFQLLAGHTQTSFINLTGLGLYAAYPLLAALAHRVFRLPGNGHAPSSQLAYGPAGQRSHQPILRLMLLGAALVPALLLCAAQLLPSLELSRLGLRTGGLPYVQAVSFSLRPRLLAQTFLPPFGAGLAEAFGSEGYAEFVAYLGIAGLLLAAFGAFSLRPPARPALHLDNRTIAHEQMARRALLLVGAAGILLALGAYDPLYLLLWRAVPGFAMFRAPARWLALYALAASGLAGVGLDWWLKGEGFGLRRPRGAWLRVPGRAVARGAVAAVLLGLAALAAYQQWPGWATVVSWVVAGAATLALLSLAARRPAASGAGLLLLAVAELWLASRALPYVQATAPAALGLRDAPATLLAATTGQPPAARDRFLSLSDLRFDPGDLGELRALQSDRLPAAAVERFVRAAKQMTVLAPNLPLQLGLPAVDGYDGGVLPLANYVKLQSLFLPPGSSSLDGRLREQLREVPPDRLLDLTGTRFVITDKQNDLWAGNVYYDLELPLVLGPGQALTLDLAGYPPFSATALGLVSYLDGASPARGPAGRVDLLGPAGVASLHLDLVAGQDTAPPGTAEGGPTVARPWPDWLGSGRDYLAIKTFAASACRPAATPPGRCAFTPSSITLHGPASGPASLVVRGVSLIDERTGAHQSITLSPRADYARIGSGDVKVYERRAGLGRAWLVHDAQPVGNESLALAKLADPGFDPRSTVIVQSGGQAIPPLLAGSTADGAGHESVRVVSYQAERVALQAQVNKPGWLVLADAFYPGWQASVDGRVAPIAQANLMFRAVELAPGLHDVVFSYAPAGWRWGARISLGALAGVIAAVVGTAVRKHE